MSCSCEKGSVRLRRQLAYLAGRAGEYAITLLVILAINFALPRLLPGDSFAYITGSTSSADYAGALDAHSQKVLRAYYGLDLSLQEQFVLYLSQLAVGDLGYSHFFKVSVNQLIAERLPWSMLLVVTGVFVALVVGVALGVLSAWRRSGNMDRGLWALLTALRSVPSFFLGSLLLLIFSVHWNLFPLFGARDMTLIYPTALERMEDILHHLTLPALTLAMGEVTGKYLLTRAAMLDTLREEYIMFSRARGFSDTAVMFRHALPNALIPVITHTGMRLGVMMGGMIFVESLFGYPGMGKLFVDAMSARDLQVLQSGFLMTSVVMVVMNLALDLVYVRLDPRVEVTKP
ncbi:MAG TPA: ABC transporter permease [Patescibacteria group bacterium]|nr:ABC transporter permease [Patescibacteria group bacterium]